VRRRAMGQRTSKQAPRRGEALLRVCAAGAIVASRPGAEPLLPTAAKLEELRAR